MATQTISSSADAESYFSQAHFILPDAIFALTAEYLKDSHPQKVNLGQGTYRDADGKPWVLPSVKKARERLLAQGLNHEYLPITGLSTFREATAELVMGQKLWEEHKRTVWSSIISLLIFTGWRTNIICFAE
jgi:aspartate aminotransferase, cytoplasmic